MRVSHAHLTAGVTISRLIHSFYDTNLLFDYPPNGQKINEEYCYKSSSLTINNFREWSGCAKEENALSTGQ